MRVVSVCVPLDYAQNDKTCVETRGGQRGGQRGNPSAQNHVSTFLEKKSARHAEALLECGLCMPVAQFCSK